MKMLRPYDFVLTKENFLFVIKNYEESEGCLIALPKYIPYSLLKIKFKGKTWRMLGEEWSRISNPLNQTPNLSTKFISCLKDYELTEGGFVIKRGDIKEEFSAREGLNRLLYQERKKTQNKIRKSAKKLINLLKEVVPEDNIGLTGSLLFRGEIEDFSDIDVVIYGSNFYKKISSFLRYSCPNKIHLRTQKEWEKFYEVYNVFSPIGKRQFAKHMVNKYDQFMILGIPVTIFAVRQASDLKMYLKYRESFMKPLKKIDLRGVVTNDRESMFLPSFYQIDTKDGERYFIYNESRSFLFQAQNGMEVAVRGNLEIDQEGNNWVKINEKNKGYITKL